MSFPSKINDAPKFDLRTRALSLTVVSVLCLVEGGCASIPRTPYSSADAASARVLDRSTLRRYADEPASTFKRNSLLEMPGRLTYLALSGGGADGAYGAGVLNGWTETGLRPSFTMVSGVSTGALIAPFAFLGSGYDSTLREFYTSGIAESLLDAPNPLNAIFGTGLFGNKRLRELVAKYIDANIINAIAAEHAKGRMLLIVTTNLDSQRTVIWDMGQIASVGTQESLELFRNVVAASASLPVVFPPMMVATEANGNRFEEMHVDGGVTAPVLTLPEAFLLRNAKIGKPGNLDLFILINNKVEREYQLVPNATLEIAARSSSTVTKTQTRSVIYSTYAFARKNNYRFNLTFIESNRQASPTSGFDTAYMSALFQHGYDKARSGRLWSSTPPSDDTQKPALPVVAAGYSRSKVTYSRSDIQPRPAATKE